MVLRAFYPMQNFVTTINARPQLLFAREACRVIEMADDTPILEM